MSRRGPYKQYETDSTIPVPRQTVHNRRKRYIDYTETEEDLHVNLGWFAHGNYEEVSYLICLLYYKSNTHNVLIFTISIVPKALKMLFVNNRMDL